MLFGIVTSMAYINAILLFFSASLFAYFALNHWIFSIVGGVFIGSFLFTLYRLILLTSMTASGTLLGDYYRNHSLYFTQIGLFNENEHNTIALSDEELIDMTSQAKIRLENIESMEEARHSIQGSDKLTVAIRVIVISIFAIICANALEIFFFRVQINESLALLKNTLVHSDENWIVENMLTEAEDAPFGLIHCRSLLMTLSVLSDGLGMYKIIFDLLTLTLFLVPLAIVYRSREMGRGDYVRKYIIDMLDHSFRMHLFLHRYKQQLQKKMLATLRKVETI